MIILRQKTKLWYKISSLLKKKNLSYLDISKKLNVTCDQIKYVAMTDKIYKMAHGYISQNPKGYFIVKNLIKKYDKQGLTYENIANRINQYLHKLNLLPNRINITKVMVTKWRMKLGFKKRVIIKSNSKTWRKILSLAKSRRYTYQQIANALNIKKTQVESVVYRQNIRQTPFNQLILNPKAWLYFKKRSLKLFNSNMDYGKMARLLNKELHSKGFLPRQIILYSDCLRHILRNKIKLPVRIIREKTYGLSTYSKFIKTILKNKKIIPKDHLSKLMYKRFKLKQSSYEQIYMKLRWKRVIASSVQRPLCYTLVNWKNTKYKIEKYKKRTFIWFTGKGRFTNADLIKITLMNIGYPTTFGQISRELKNRFKLNISGWDLGIIINSERIRAKRHKKFPNIDVITHKIKDNLIFLYTVPEIVTIDKITPSIERKLIREHKIDLKDHLRDIRDGKELDTCLKNIACHLWNFKRDVVLKNGKRPDLILKDKIIEIKKVIDAKTITSINQKYGKYANFIEVWYLNKKPNTFIDTRRNINLKSVNEVLDCIKKPVPRNIYDDYEYLKDKFIK